MRIPLEIFLSPAEPTNSKQDGGQFGGHYGGEYGLLDLLVGYIFGCMQVSVVIFGSRMWLSGVRIP
jgi:hypothetical protein